MREIRSPLKYTNTYNNKITNNKENKQQERGRIEGRKGRESIAIAREENLHPLNPSLHEKNKPYVETLKEEERRSENEMRIKVGEDFCSPNSKF